MRLIPCKTEDDVSSFAASYIVNKINRKNSNEKFILGLPTGRTPLKTYKKLIELFKNGNVSFANVVTFNMDEYFGLRHDDPQSYQTFMFENFFNHIDIKIQNVNLLDGCCIDHK